MTPFKSIPFVVDASVVAGATNRPESAPDLLIEIPHGATRTEDFVAVEQALSSPLPSGLVDFFHVNTDAGAPELAEAAARAFVAEEPEKKVLILRCRIPRTFIDCNRRMDASPSDFTAGKVTPGLMPWVTTSADRALLRERYDAYVAAVSRATEVVMPQGAMLLLHTYAPRSVGVDVDLQIVESLHAAYAPAMESTWPLRPAIDVIGKSADGRDCAPASVFAALKSAFAKLDVDVAAGETYPLHHSTLAHGHVMRFPGRVLCLEVRRDLVADPFEPFVQMRISPQKVAKVAQPLARSLRAWWP